MTDFEDFPADQRGDGARRHFVGGETSTEQANGRAKPIFVPPARPNLPATDQQVTDAPTARVGGGDLSSDDSQGAFDTRCASAVVAPTPEQTKGDPAPAPAEDRSEPNLHPLVLADPLLGMAADVLDDLERVRIANENRLRQLTRSTEDSDGEERGFGLTLDHPDVARLAALVDALTKAEHDTALNLQRLVRRHPLGPWVKQARGVGEKQAGRLLAAIGDPYINTLHDRPRTVSELWAYSGYHVIRPGHLTSAAHPVLAGSEQSGGNPNQRCADTQGGPVGVAASRARGQRANWSATAKMRAHLVAVSIVKAGGPYRDVYDEARAKYADAVHQVECRRCGPAGKPAAVGSQLSAGHQHARALRIVAKTVLRDLWREAKRLHEEASS